MSLSFATVLAVLAAAAAAGVAWWRMRRRLARQRRREGLLGEGRQALEARQLDAALRCFDEVLDAQAQDLEATFGRGAALLGLRRLDDAAAAFDAVIAREPSHAQAHYRRGNVWLQQQRAGDALACYDRAVAIEPDFADAHYNRGLALQALRRTREAIDAYDRALQLQPDDAEALNNRGNAWLELRRPERALQSYRQALSLQPDLADARFNCGVALQDLKRPDEAAEAYARARALRPDHPFVLGRLLHARMLACDWRDFEGLSSELDAQVRQGAAAAEPFGYLASAESPADLRRAAEQYALAHRAPDGVAPLWRGERYRHERIRIGYLSGDFRQQATAILMVELFERHDRKRFELHALDTGWSDGSPMRRRIEAAFDAVVDLSRLGDAEAAAELRRREIDIVVDLNGYFGFGRPGILARRPCPVQVNYLGFPGTLGAPHMDYLLADEVVIPRTDAVHYTERIVWLPGCYQANDTRRAVPEAGPTRAEAGLPDAAFVFCCFNNNFKITPAMFARWMAVLQRVEHGVLWLLADNAAAAENLRREALRHGIAPQRLVFADRQPLDAHLARHRLADLFLDTLPCNAHTTASDALWAGLPLLTCQGTTFPGRVAASLLRALELHELVADSPDEYVERAVSLATRPATLQGLRARLHRHRLDHAPFAPGQLCRHIEAAFVAMWTRAQQGESPAPIDVAALPTNDRPHVA